MADEHGDGFFGSEIKKSQRLIIEQDIAKAYADGLHCTPLQAGILTPSGYARNKMAELEKKMGGRPW